MKRQRKQKKNYRIVRINLIQQRSTVWKPSWWQHLKTSIMIQAVCKCRLWKRRWNNPKKIPDRRIIFHYPRSKSNRKLFWQKNRKRSRTVRKSVRWRKQKRKCLVRSRRQKSCRNRSHMHWILFHSFRLPVMWSLQEIKEQALWRSRRILHWICGQMILSQEIQKLWQQRNWIRRILRHYLKKQQMVRSSSTMQGISSSLYARVC